MESQRLTARHGGAGNWPTPSRPHRPAGCLRRDRARLCAKGAKTSARCLASLVGWAVCGASRVRTCAHFFLSAPCKSLKLKRKLVALTGIEGAWVLCWLVLARLSLVVSVLAILAMLRKRRCEGLWCLPGACQKVPKADRSRRQLIDGW